MEMAQSGNPEDQLKLRVQLLCIELRLELHPGFDNVHIGHTTVHPPAFLDFETNLFTLICNVLIVRFDILQCSTVVFIVQILGSVWADGVD